MATQWKGSVRIAAPVDDVFAYLADFNRHTEWDESTASVEQLELGDANGVGAKFKVHEHLQTLRSDLNARSVMRPSVGLAGWEVREVVPGNRISWNSYAIPRFGVTADFTFTFASDGDGTVLTESVDFHVPAMLDAAARKLFKGIDEKQTSQWQRNLENIKRMVEQTAPVREMAHAGD
ncbi:MAG: SRPBCC family protein [Chloroflexota bacterium]|nr:SRPBCC family protein [Chloroflexota bacterium]